MKTSRMTPWRWTFGYFGLVLGACAIASSAGEPPVLKSVPADFTTVDIRPHVNMGWKDDLAGDGKGGWSDQGENDMANAPVGLRECRGIPFDIIDAAKNGGKAVMVFKSANFKPGLSSVTIPLNGAKAAVLYVLQAAAYLNGGAAKFTLAYEDGTKSKPLQAWENIRVCNWWDPADGGHYKVAFTAKNAVRDSVGMVAMEWVNEFPDKPLTSLLIESYDQDTVMLIGAVTLSRKKGSAFSGAEAPAVAAAAGAGSRPDASRGKQAFFYPPRSDHEDIRNWGQVQKRQLVCKALLDGSDGVGAVAGYLREDVEQDEIYTRLMALAYLLDRENKAAVAGAVCDKLQSENDLGAAILAADVLLKTMAATGADVGGSVRAVAALPDALCERAAALLDHPDPVVQSMAEWMLTLRFKKQNSKTNRLQERFSQSDRAKPWFRKWQSRPPDRLLTDDYCRQLVQVDRHRTLSGLESEIQKVDARMRKLLADPASDVRAASAGQAAYGQSLQRARAAVAAKDLLAAHQAYPALRLAARDITVACRREFPREGIVFFTNDRLPGGDWNINMPVTGDTNPPGGDIYTKKGFDPAAAAVPLKVSEALGSGSVRGMDLYWDSSKILFSYWHQPVNPASPSGWDRKNAFLYELDVASGKVTQLTRSPGDNDIEPCYLPDGGVIFSSDRSSFGNQCAGPFIQDKRCTTLYRTDPRRSDRPVAISNNKDFDRFPHILNDGTVVFMHWEYQERDLYHLQTAWRCRPDGSNMDAFYKQHISVPYSIRGVQQVPGSPLCVATAQGHHDASIGPVILFNPSLGINNAATMQLVTFGAMGVEGGLGPLHQQVVPEGGVENRGGSYTDPFPLSEKAFLAGHDMEGLGGYKRSSGMNEYALYYIDVWGNRELIHRDKEMNCFMPHPLSERRRPPVVADTVDPKATYATAFVENVYRDLPGVEKGAVKYLRISQSLMLPAPVDYNDPEYRYNHLHWLPGDSTAVHFGYWTFSPSRTIGIVQVEKEGSAYFKVPAGTPVYLQALDENYCEVRRMRTSFTLQRGEFRGCVGCHESRLEAAGTQPYSRATLAKGPQTPVPPPWGDLAVQDYRRDIQPIFDTHCIACHGEKNPKAGLDLTGRPAAGFTQSYRSLFGIKPGDPQIVNELSLHMDIHPEAKDAQYVSGKEGTKAIKLMQQNQYPGQLISISDKNSRDASVTQPYQFGSNKSRLIRILLDDPAHRKVRAEIPQDEWLALVAWVDHNANFHSTLMDKSRYNREKTVTRVPYYLPSPWVPADLNPSFYNQKGSSIVPQVQAAK